MKLKADRIIGRGRFLREDNGWGTSRFISLEDKELQNSVSKSLPYHTV